MITVEKAAQIAASPEAAEAFVAGDPGEAVHVLAQEIVRRGTRRRRLYAVNVILRDGDGNRVNHKYLIAARGPAHAKARILALTGVEHSSITEVRNPFLMGTTPLEQTEEEVVGG